MTTERQRKIFAIKNRIFQTNYSLWSSILTINGIFIATLSILTAIKPHIFHLNILLISLTPSIIISFSIIYCFHSVRREHKNKIITLMLKERKESKGDKDEDDESHDKETIEKKMRHIFIGEVIAYVSLVILFFILTIPIILHVRCENTKKEISNPNTAKNNAHMQNITIHKKPAP